MELGGQQIELGRGDMAAGGGGRGLGWRRARGFLGTPVSCTLGRQQAIEAQAGLRGGLDVQQGIMGG